MPYRNGPPFCPVTGLVLGQVQWFLTSLVVVSCRESDRTVVSTVCQTECLLAKRW